MRALVYISLSFFIFLFSLGCSNDKSTITVSGSVKGMPAQEVYLEELGITQRTVVDSAKSDADGRFQLSTHGIEPALYRIRIGGIQSQHLMLLSIDHGHVDVSSNWSNTNKYEVTGSPASSSLISFIDTMDENMLNFGTYEQVLDTLKNHNDTAKLKMATLDYANARFQFTQTIEQYADTTHYLPNALFAVQVLNRTSEKDFLSSFNQSLPRRFPNSKMQQEFSSRLTALLDVPGQVKLAAEINLPTPEGKMISLSSLRGKYVLVDFWASWCPPCRAENPNVVAAYQQFKDKNFTIYSVSLDEHKDAWQEAIAKDGLTWTHVSDLKGWDATAAHEYGVESIPANFLVDPKGNIIATNLRGPDLQAKLAQVLK